MFGCIYAEQPFYLKENLSKAKPGDFIVIATNRTDTLMHISSKQDQRITIEEIAIPEGKKPANMNWRDWVQNNAPENTSWVMYEIDLSTGKMLRYYSFTKKGWYDIPEADNLLGKLLNLNLAEIPSNKCKRIGPRASSGLDVRPLWQPRMIVDGKPVQGVKFKAYQTRWPKDDSELSNRHIEIYLPEDSTLYPSYFPFWLQVSGAVGKAKIRIIDSGNDLKSPKSINN